jgi:HTH-type transcriptional regulator, sugar sensing transcriptional regulator
MILQKLLKAGLNEREARVYIALLELGEATIAEITKKAQIKRSTVYDVLELLKDKRLVSRTYRKKRPIYYSENPKKIIEELEEKKRGMEEAMPELVSIMNLLDKKPKIRYFEGVNAVKEIFEDTLRVNDSEILTWFPCPYLNLSKEYFWNYYDPERTKKKIWMRTLAPETNENIEALKRSEKYLVTTKFVSKNLLSDFDIEIKIYGKSKIGIISHEEDLGIIIESKKIYNGFKTIFEMTWKLLPDNK